MKIGPTTLEEFQNEFDKQFLDEAEAEYLLAVLTGEANRVRRALEEWLESLREEEEK